MWRSTLGTLDSRWLVFVDEMGTHTSLAPLYAYSPRGKRAFFKVPRNRGKNTTLLASMGWEGMGPSRAPGLIKRGRTGVFALWVLTGA